MDVDKIRRMMILTSNGFLLLLFVCFKTLEDSLWFGYFSFTSSCEDRRFQMERALKESDGK